MNCNNSWSKTTKTFSNRMWQYTLVRLSQYNKNYYNSNKNSLNCLLQNKSANFRKDFIKIVEIRQAQKVKNTQKVKAIAIVPRWILIKDIQPLQIGLTIILKWARIFRLTNSS